MAGVGGGVSCCVPGVWWRHPAELVQVHDECDVTQTSPDELPVIDIRSL